MPDMPEKSQVARPPKFWAILKFLMLSPLISGLIGGLFGVAVVLFGSVVNPNDFLRDPGGFSVLFFIVWGFLGSILGLVVGIIGAIVIAIRR